MRHPQVVAGRAIQKKPSTNLPFWFWPIQLTSGQHLCNRAHDPASSLRWWLLIRETKHTHGINVVNFDILVAHSYTVGGDFIPQEGHSDHSEPAISFSATLAQRWNSFPCSGGWFRSFTQEVWYWWSLTLRFAPINTKPAIIYWSRNTRTIFTCSQ